MALATKRVPALLVTADPTHTPGVEIESARFISLRTPIAAAITFEGSVDANTASTPTPVWSPIRDAAGVAVGFTTVANSWQALPDACLSVRWIRAVTPSQGSNQLFEFSIKEDR